MALLGEPPRGALYWGGHNLINFPSYLPPLRLEAKFMYLLISFKLSFGVLWLFSKTQLPRFCQDRLLCGALLFRILNMVINKKNQPFTQYFFKLRATMYFTLQILWASRQNNFQNLIIQCTNSNSLLNWRK